MQDCNTFAVEYFLYFDILLSIGKEVSCQMNMKENHS